ncbi:unnamed protein product [Cutaneotrichosporon oleaginosum]
MLSRSASQRGAKLPQLSRRPSAKDDAPADALKPDEDAIDDVFAQVQETGTLDGAARRLAALAAAEDGPGTAQSQRRQGWWDDPEEAAYFAAQGDEDESEIEHLNEVVDGLWIGDLVAAMDAEGMRERGITNVVSLLRPRLDFAPDFAAYAIEIDDAPDTDILTVLPAAVAWIAEALARRDGDAAIDERAPELQSAAAPQTKAGAVLVHCQAGMSRSATVVAAYLMRHRRLDPVEAVSFLREKRPVVDPSDTFWHQLGLYYLADGRVTLKDRSTRQFYLERTTGYVMNEGGAPSTEHMAKYPATPTPSQPATPAGGHRRKIRCKMCRQHLALREHMMDHILDQSPAPPSRPRTPSNFALPAPLAGLSTDDNPIAVDDDDAPAAPPHPRRPSIASDIINPLTGLPASLSRRASLASEGGRARSRSLLGLGPDGLSMTRANSMGADDDKPARRILDADQLTARLPPQLAALRAASGSGSAASSPPNTNPPSPAEPRRRASSTLQFTPAAPHPAAGGITGGPPILVNPKCSGYFVEPLTWMEPVLANGDVAGKLVCPNPKCGAKIGSYDWAGVQCGCKEWVTPGFCISRSKVDEVW